MKKTLRLFAVAMLLLVVSSPAFAICGFCNLNDECQYDPESTSGCRTVRGIDWWYCDTGFCRTGGLAPEATPSLELVDVKTELASVTIEAPRTAEVKIADAAPATR
jgi:hypothetical protein